MKICECCGTQFHARLSATRTCGVACRNRLIAAEKAEKHKSTKACPVCKSDFEVTGANPHQQTCSKECSYKLRGENRSDRVDMKCATCGNVFAALRSKAERGGPLYCSKACFYERNKAAMTRQCECCGQSFSSPPSHSHVKTCSQECGYKISSGENKPNYKGLTELVVIDGVKKSRRTAYGSGVHNTMRRVSIALATPSWASQEKIRKIYELRAKIDEMTGIKHHVDHVVPLNSKLVCGLHNEFNLAVMLGAENVRKNNRHWPDMW